MIFVDQMKNLKIYKKPLFLPTVEMSKKKNSAIFLLTPNRESSLNLMKSSMTINKLRFESYYIEKDLTYFISSKILKSDENIDENYKRFYQYQSSINEDGAQSDDEIFNSKICYSGYDSDVDNVRKIFNGFTYYVLWTEDLANEVSDKVPYLHISVQSAFDEKEIYRTSYRDHDGNTYISISIPAYRSGSTSDGYSRNVLGFIMRCIIYGLYPYINNSALPNILSDYSIGLNSIYNTYGEYLFGTEDSDGVITKADYKEICASNNYKALIDILKTKFPDVDRKALNIYDDQLSESKSTTTIENIDSKFKYAISTKLKRDKSRKVNGIKRLLKQFSDDFESNSIIFNAPKMGAGSSFTSTRESSVFELDSLKENTDYIKIGNDRVVFLESNTKYDIPLKRILYSSRIRQRKTILEMDKAIKLDDPEIKYAYPDLDKYNNRNLFVDLYYYNQVFFINNTLKLKKGFDIYLELIDRLVNDPRIEKAGYTKKTIFIPILDWNKNPKTKMWLYRENLNPISIIYQLMYTQSNLLKKVFANKELIFFGKNKYFKINFDYMTPKDLKSNSIIFKSFVNRILSNQEFDSSDVEDDSMKQSSDAIKTNIYDAIDKSKGVDLTGKEKISKDKTNVMKKQFKNDNRIGYSGNDNVTSKTAKELNDIDDESISDEELSKAADKEEKIRRQNDLERLATIIDDISQNSNDTDAALDAMDNDDELKNLLNDLGTDNVDISATRSARINNLTDKFMDNTIDGKKTVRQMLEENPSEKNIETTALNLGTPNEEWNNMTYMNFDKDYNLDRDIVNCFKHFSEVSLPMAIRKLTVTDKSTSEDRIDLYSVEMEDYRGKRFTIKLDIPRMIDNRFLLRGNEKIIETQFLNMPILKTDLDTAQIITNYQKIFVRRFRNSTGKSTPITSRLIKALQKYEGKDIKVEYGDNSQVCNKYQLPIDYIDLSSIFNTITYNHFIIYFNQDLIRNLYTIDDSKGVPFCYNTEDKSVIYYKDITDYSMLSVYLVNILKKSEGFFETFNKCRPSISGTYSRCSILSTDIPLIVVTGYTAGLSEIIKRVNDSETRFIEKIDNATKADYLYDYIKFADGYLIYRTDNYVNIMLYNGLKDCPCDQYNMADMDKKSTYIEFLDNFGGRIKSDGLDNFNDCLVDPITKEILEYYKLPTNFVDILLYTNAMLADNAFIRHTDTSSRRIRRNEMVAAYTYEALSEGYALWANQIKHGRNNVSYSIKESSVIDKLLSSPISQDDSFNNALGAVEETNTISFKGKSGLNSDRSYSLDKRTYDDSMTNVLGMSTGFSANVGITRQATMDMNVEGERGYIKQNNGNIDNMNSAKTLTATEAMVPFCTESDDPQRVAMTFIQTAKHQVRTENSDPLLVSNGADEAVPYLTTDAFAYKAKKNGKVIELTDDYMIIQYNDNTSEYVDLTENVKKNSDGGYYIPMKLTAIEKLKVGSAVKPNQIIAYDNTSFSKSVGEDDNLKYNVGKLAKVAVLCSDEGFEDSGICTEKISKDLSTNVIYKFDRIISKDATIYTVAKIGDHVDVNDSLLVWQDPYDDSNANIVVKAIADEDDKKDVSELGRKAIRSDTSGTLVNIKIYRTCEIKDMSNTMQKLVSSYEAPINKLRKKLGEHNISNVDLPASYKLDPVGKLKKAEDSILIEFYIEYTDLVGIGDKITFFGANKCTIKSVIDSKDTPRTEFRPNEEVSAMLSVSGINGRMITSILRIGAMQKLMVELDRSVKDMLGIPYDDSQA